MNILEAFEKSDIIKRECWEKYRQVVKSDDMHTLHLKSVLATDWEPVIEPLTFKRIRRECVSGKTLLINHAGGLHLYLGFDRSGKHLITDRATEYGSNEWRKEDIHNWQISSEKWEE